MVRPRKHSVIKLRDRHHGYRELGVWCFTDRLTPEQLTETAQTAERLGYGTLWYVEAASYESFSLGCYLLGQTKSLNVASGIANIYGRDATAARQAQHSLNLFSGGRFLLGLGVSHRPIVEDYRGHKAGSPVPAMAAYLDAMENAAAFAPPLEETPPTVLAALGPKMIELAGARTAGAHSYNVNPEHTAGARKILGPDKWLCVEQKVLLLNDAAKAERLPVRRCTVTPNCSITGIAGAALALPRRNWRRAAATVSSTTWLPGETRLPSSGASRNISMPAPATFASSLCTLKGSPCPT